VRKRTTIFTIILSLLFVSGLSAAQRGIKVTAKSGDSVVYLYKDYHALVVGVGDYDYWPDLQGAVKDAKEVAEQLERSGIKTKLVLNPTSRELKRALNQLTYGPGKVKDRAILFFYSGHGETETLATGEKMGYLVPKDAPIPSQDRIGFTDTAISMNAIASYALRIKSKHVLMLFDSCFSGSLFSSLKGIPTDISEKSNRPVRQFITAGNENEQVPDNSIFKTCFLQGIEGEADLNNDGYVTGSELGLYLDSSVVNYTRGSQHPQYGKIRHPKLDKGDFVFALKMHPKSPAAVSPESGDVRDYGKIIKERNANRNKWNSWQKSMETDLAKVERYDKSNALNAKEKAEAWDGLLASYRADNPYSVQDNQFREKARERARYWKEYKKSGKLFVDIAPPGARIRILNMDPEFYQGMDLKPGRYHVETSKQGYETRKIWVELQAGEDKRVKVKLEQLQASIQDTTAYVRRPSTTSNIIKQDGTHLASTPQEPSHSRPSSTSDVINRDGIYVAYANGIVKDTNTGLEWKVGPDKDTSWNEAKSWVKSLNLDGGGWRMPSMDELEGLYKEGSGDRNMTPLLKTTGYYVWSGEIKGSSKAKGFNFDDGSRYSTYRDYYYSERAFAVRSRGDG
jgi:hypothetical protein